MHHAGNADGANRRQRFAEFFLHVAFQIRKAALQPPVDGVHGVGPDPVPELVFPFVAAGGDGGVIPPDEDGFDAGGAEFDAQGRLPKIHIVFLP